MRTYKLTIAYDGSRYQGWQRQPSTDLTIQGTLEKTISGILGYDVEVQGSGRTDGGVHAKGQTASIVLRGKIEEAQFLSECAKRLQEDICIWKIELVKNGFHARHSARGKCYVYTVDTREKADVFSRKYTGHYPGELDVSAMGKAAGILVGAHDFAGFTDRKDEKSTIRRIYDIMIERQGEKVVITYRGSGFMYHMVRILTGTLLEVGSGMRSIESVGAALESKVRADAGFLAQASGLTLREVYYH